MVVLLDTIRGSTAAISQELLYSSDSIKIWYEPDEQWLYTEWTGSLNLHTVQQNGQEHGTPHVSVRPGDLACLMFARRRRLLNDGNPNAEG